MVVRTQYTFFDNVSTAQTSAVFYNTIHDNLTLQIYGTATAFSVRVLGKPHNADTDFYQLQSVYIGGSNTTFENIKLNLTATGVYSFDLTDAAELKIEITSISGGALTIIGQFSYCDTSSSTASYDTDFIGFSYNGKHSINDLHIYRVSDSARYKDDLTPTINDTANTNTGTNGTTLIRSKMTKRTFSVSFAFDALSEVDLRTLRQTFASTGVHPLIFDERPYKVWDACIADTVPQIKTICFDKYNATTQQNDRVYKGEGTVNFVCYYPYAHTPTGQQSLNSYTCWSRSQWAESSSLPVLPQLYMNYGDIDAIFTVQQSTPSISGSTYSSIILTLTNGITATLNLESGATYANITWDSKIGLISADVSRIVSETTTTTHEVVSATGNLCSGLPVNKTSPFSPTLRLIPRSGTEPSVSFTNYFTLTYHYWYY